MVEYFVMAVIFLPQNPQFAIASTVLCSKGGTGAHSAHLWLALGRRASVIS